MTIQVVKGHDLQALDSPLFQFYLNCKTGIRTVKARFTQGLDSTVFMICNKP